MDSIVKDMMCFNCDKKRNLNISALEEGRKESIYYFVRGRYKGYKKYQIVGDYTLAQFKDMRTFAMSICPKFGKCEVEEFVAERLLNALIVTKDITDLMNMELLCIDEPHSLKVSSEMMREKILTIFDVVEENDVVKLKLKG